MPTPSRPPRLILRRRADGPASWQIRDEGKRIATGCPASDRMEAEKALAAYIAEKHDPTGRRNHDPDRVSVADVLNLYVQHAGASVSRPAALGGRIDALLTHFGRMSLSDVNAGQCRAYAARRGSQSAARRELEDLRAAIGHHRREGLHDRIISVTLPPRPKARERWLSRSEIARLIWAAWRFRQRDRGRGEGRHVRRHVARFIVTAIYSASRSGAILDASYEPLPGRGLVDLDVGVWHRLPDQAVETQKRRPSIRVPVRLLAHMRRWRANGARHVVEFDTQPVELIKKAFAAVAKDAGLPDVTAHVLRHSAITWAMMAGSDPWAIGGYSGMSPKMVELVYGHFSPSHLGAVGETLTRAGRYLPRTRIAEPSENKRA